MTYKLRELMIVAITVELNQWEEIYEPHSRVSNAVEAIEIHGKERYYLCHESPSPYFFNCQFNLSLTTSLF
jgi:hypothetical protein